MYPLQLQAQRWNGKGRASRPGAWCWLGLWLACGAVGAETNRAVQETHAPASVKAGDGESSATPAPKRSVTHHSLRLQGKSLDYTATAGFLPLKDSAGKAQADLFFIAYTQATNAGLQRPVSFVFNGGPGASSMWLHLGGIGPRRVPLPAEGTELPANERLVDNEQTWLEFTDLVFVDPVGTGYSRAAKGVSAKEFYARQKDVEAAAEFIRLYVTEFERWRSPKLVIGESYGTTRAAGLASHLQQEQGLDLAGLVLLSSALNFETFLPGPENDLPYALALPTFQAVARYHQKLPAPATADLAQALLPTEQWALSDYLVALAKGDTLSAPERSRLSGQLAARTGLTTNYLDLSRQRVSSSRFAKELLRDQGRTLGMLDGRVKGVDLSRLGEHPRYDPALFLTTGPYVAVLNDYLRRELNFKTSEPYEFLSEEANGTWKWENGGPVGLSVGDELAQAMAKDGRLRVFAGAGYYDLTTPYLGQRYTFEHLGLEPERRRNLTWKIYPSGHQIYVEPSCLKQLTVDVGAFVRRLGSGESGER